MSHVLNKSIKRIINQALIPKLAQDKHTFSTPITLYTSNTTEHFDKAYDPDIRLLLTTGSRRIAFARRD